MSSQWEKLQRYLAMENASWSILEEKIISDQSGFLFPNEHFLFESFNEKIIQMVESGIANFIVNKEDRELFKETANNTVTRKIVPDDENTVLAVFHLGNWFFGLLIALSLAGTVFFIELIVAQLRRNRKHQPEKRRNTLLR